MSRKTIGSSAENDLVLSHASIAALHAIVELEADGSIYVSSAGPQAELWLVRGEQRQRAQRICLSLDDRLMLGQEEIPVSRVTGLYETTAGARLRHRKDVPGKPRPALSPARSAEPAALPRRNPVTGAIEN